MLTRVTGRVDCFGCVCALQTILCFMCIYVHVLLYCVLFYLYLLCSRKANFYVLFYLYLLCSRKANFYVIHRQ